MDLDDPACYRAIATRDARFDGRLFTGVKTTGVYCRPICPARTPKPENVTFFPSAAAAQSAGFRPCLRCRPETSPDLAAWRGTSNTVSRALALIETGALDDGDVEALADRLGVGGRQLRRLFRQHLGVSPMAVAQTRRVLLAKQLIQDTALPMAQVALASGFGSIRRFNETFQQLYDRPPLALRRRATGAAIAPGERLSIRLSYRTPYDWPAMLGFLAARAIPGVEAISGETYARTICARGDCGLLKVAPHDGQILGVEIHLPRLDALPAIIAKVRGLFDLAADPLAIGDHLSRDPLLAPLVAARPGLRVPGAWDGLELAIRAILGQQISVRAATRLVGRLALDHGQPLPHGLAGRIEGLTRLFPTASALAGADLSGLGIPRARAAALSAVAAAALADPLIFSPGHGLDDAVARLKRLPGVGEWTAQYVALRQLREPDAFPHGDIGLIRSIARAEGHRLTPAELLARASAWRPWRAYAALHLWAADSPSHPLETVDDRSAA